jgi:hypothetical protein
MPSRTLTPAAPAVSGQDVPPEPTPGSASSPGPTALASPAGPAGPVAPAGSAALAAPGGPTAWSGLRLVKVPAGWPPYDCETHGAACPAARSAATADSAATGADGRVVEPAGSRGPAPRAGLGPRADVAAQPDGADRGAAWPVRLAQVIVEVLAGFRSPNQLVPCTTERVRAQIDLLGRALPSSERPRIRRIMTSRPAAGVVEMTVVVGFGPRSRALAMRFEHMPARQGAPGRPPRPARWLCTEVETG